MHLKTSPMIAWHDGSLAVGPRSNSVSNPDSERCAITYLVYHLTLDRMEGLRGEEGRGVVPSQRSERR